MDVSIGREDGVVWVAVTGRVDGETAGECHETVMASLEETDRFLVFDATGMSYISSAGLRVILMLVKHFNASGGKMVLCGLSPEVSEVFSVIGFDQVMEVAGDREAARAAISLG